MSIMDRAAAAGRRAVNAVMGRPIRVHPMAASGSPNAAAQADPVRPAFLWSGVFYTFANQREEPSPRDYLGRMADQRGLHERQVITLTMDRPTTLLRTGDLIQREDVGEWFQIIGIDPDDVGTVTLRLARAKSGPSL